MQVSNSRYRVLKEAITTWQQEKVIDATQAKHLLKNLTIEAFDWKRLAKWCTWIAIICLLISLGALVADKWFIYLIKQLFGGAEIKKVITLSLISGLLYYWGMKRKIYKPNNTFTNEAILFLGVVFTACAIWRLGILIDTGSGHFSLLLLLAAILYALLGVYFRSIMIWVFALLSFGSWMGAETGYMSGWGAYYLGMNYPIRFVLLGLIMRYAAFEMKRFPISSIFHLSTLKVGLLYLFIGLWILSIFGDSTSWVGWLRVKQIELFHWSLLFALASIAAIFHGLKLDNSITRNFGMTFLLINLYTRYFEFFWDSTNKAIFFAILAISFWFIALRAEQIYSLRIFQSKPSNAKKLSNPSKSGK